jgi:lipoprotein-releasing system permease protein
MFELSIALKYLIPRKRQLSVSLIALLSVLVISLVVALALIFLSVTEGMERNWLNKLTALNAPLRILPTEEYYNSYYYQVDAYSSASDFTYKNIAQKARAETSDPYALQEDAELPPHFPKAVRDKAGLLIDPVKEAQSVLNQLPGVSYQDFELSGALMRLQLLRHRGGENTQSFLTQVSYVATLPDRSPAFASMLLPLEVKELNHLFYLSGHATQNARIDNAELSSRVSAKQFSQRLFSLLQKVQIDEIKSRSPSWRIPLSLLPENTPFHCIEEDGALFLPRKKEAAATTTVWRQSNQLFMQKQGETLKSTTVPLFTKNEITFAAHKAEPESLTVTARIQDKELCGKIGWEDIEITKARSGSFEMALEEEGETGVYLAKNYKESGVLVGDRGYLSYTSSTASAIQEQRLPIFVAGFYDPGILSVGNRCIFAPPFVTELLNKSASSFQLDKRESNGMLVWLDDLSAAKALKSEIEQRFAKTGISSMWKVVTFHDYPFAKDLLLQFQSDKYLFSLIAAIILLVACCNIISLLTLLVNDKKREIGILQAMGASPFSIALIFGLCGIILGIVSCLIGGACASWILKHIDQIVTLLSRLQGRDAFNAAFFGASLPNTLSASALKFILCLTPLLSLLAGLVPAIKACRLKPAEILRSQ